MRPYKVIILPDIHFPHHDKKALSVVEKYLADEVWDEWICLGDLLDFSQISSFNKTALRKIEGETLRADYDLAGEFLDRHQKLVRKRNRKAKFTLIEGNHEYRCEKYIDEHPQLRGLLEVEHGLKLKERGIKWVRNWSKGEMHTIGKAMFAHGLYVGVNHAKKMLDTYGSSGKSIIYGHTHDTMSQSRVSFGKHLDIMAQSLGSLCLPEQDYIGKKPTNWTQAFGVFYFHKGGDFNHYVVKLRKHSFFAPNGKFYTA